ncbi:MAG: WYL domain-containing protein [Bacteroidales bacterium]|nr:WYL domain-containing protein [Bacteroidales bacterium]
MSKRAFISRYFLIYRKLKTTPYANFDEIRSFLQMQEDQLQLEDDLLRMNFSVRTFQRDLRELKNLFGIEVLFSRQEKGYYILEDDQLNIHFQRMMEAFDLLNSIHSARKLEKILLFEKRMALGTEYIALLIQAIRKRLQISFVHRKFWDKHSTMRLVCPYAIKESQGRLYLIGKETGNPTIKTFGLDRMKSLQLTGTHFDFPIGFDPEDFFRYSFGIIAAEELEAENVELSFSFPQGNYIKTLPLHPSQEIVLENETELQIRLQLRITFDFEMELMKYGTFMRVLKPQSLVETIKNKHKLAYEQY